MNVFKKLFKKTKRPIVFVPGLFGSLGDDIIPGTGEFKFGPAIISYKPLIDILSSMGYKINKNLFIAFYDWRKKNLFNAQKYLNPIINKAKANNSVDKVNIISHSMGGLVTRSYIQNRQYQNDIDKFIMIGTPNCGAINAYYFWEGGVLPYKIYDNNVIFRILWEGFTWYLKKIYNENNTFKMLHKYFTSIGELLPTIQYGDYLFEEKELYKQFLSIHGMRIKNNFLDELNSQVNDLYNTDVDIHLIIGKGVNTRKFICVENSTEGDKWLDGKPKYTIDTNLGDGTVTCESSNFVKGDVRYIEGNHTDILSDSYKELEEILDEKTNYDRKIKNNSKDDFIYSIVTKDVEKMYIQSPFRNILVKDNEVFYDDEVLIYRLAKNDYWVIFTGKTAQNYKISITTSTNQKGNILILCGKEKQYISKLEKEGIYGNYVLNI